MKECLKSLKISEFNEEDWLHLAYICLLQRNIDDTAYEWYMEKIGKKIFNYKELLDSLICSPEYIMHYNIPFDTVLHKTRQKWIKTLPFFAHILDIGGSSPNIEEGALIELGYPFRPNKITVFDLPLEQQYWGTPSYDQKHHYSFSWGEVEYLYGRAEKITDVEYFKDKLFDCVYLGQTIEHIEPSCLPKLLEWIFNHLKNEGKLIFDTPNRLLTKIRTPNSFIDRDHKYEYNPDELEEILKKAHYKIIKKWGLLHMPSTFSTGVFNPLEVYDTKDLNEIPEESYCFAFEAVRII